MKLAVAALLAGSAAAFAPSTLGGRSATQLDARKPFISGNWKLNPQTRDEAVKLAGDIAASITDDSPDADVALFVPYVFLEAAMGAAGDKLMVGAEVCVSLSLRILIQAQSKCVVGNLPTNIYVAPALNVDILDARDHTWWYRKAIAICTKKNHIRWAVL